MPPPLAIIEFGNNRAISPMMDSSNHSESTTVSTGLRGRKHRRGTVDVEQEYNGSNLLRDRSSEKSKKSVQFKMNVRVRKISSHKTYTDDERNNMWYSKEETKLIRASAVATVKKMIKGKVVETEDDCVRGLEFKTPKKFKVRQQRTKEIIRAVLIEQEEQFEAGLLEVDAHYLAHIYICCNRACAIEAAKIGAKDEIAAWRSPAKRKSTRANKHTDQGKDTPSSQR